MDENVEVTPKSWHKTIEIEKGDTLWGLSREHGVNFFNSFNCYGITHDMMFLCLYFSLRICIHTVILVVSNCAAGIEKKRSGLLSLRF